MFAEGIPYRYECPLVLSDGGTVHPDFTVLNRRTRREFFWEHLGKLSDPGYVDDNLVKLARYEESGIFQGDRLLVTRESESRPLSTNSIMRIIDKFLR